MARSKLVIRKDAVVQLVQNNGIWLGLGLAIAAMTLASCTGKQTASDVKVTNGERTTDWPTAIALTGSDFLCSGTLVAPRLVITAAHCLSDRPNQDELTITIGDSVQTGAAYGVDAYNINPGFDVANAESSDPAVAINDYAYLRLSKDVVEVKPADYVLVLTDPAEISELLAPGAASTIVGFGTTQVTPGTGFTNTTASSQTDELGLKHEATTTVGPDEEGALFIGGDGVDTCQGDSGGPAFGQLKNGQLRVYGITSRGNGCGPGGVYARMADGLCWIQQDSGVTVPGSTLACPGITNIPPLTAGGATSTSTGSATSTGTGTASNTGTGTGTQTVLTGHDLHMFMGAGDDTNGYTVYLSADGGTASVGICIGDKPSCLANPVVDLPFDASAHTASGLSFFASSFPLPVFDGLQMTLLGFDASGKLTAATGVQLNSAN